MNNLYFVLLLAVSQFFSSTETPNSPEKETPILKDSIPFVCGQPDGYDDFLKQHPDVLEKQNRWEREQKKRLETKQSTARRGTAYEIPVVIHIIHDNGTENISDAEVAQGIQYLNEGFAGSGRYAGVGGIDTEMTFRLAERDPNNNPTTGINRIKSGLTEMLKSQDLEVKNLIRWDPTCYVNFWLVREICKSGGDCGVAGYAYFPGSHGRDEDGIVMEARHFADSEFAIVQIHEVGHYLGLYHTFQGGCKNDDCLIDGDQVCDTPPDQSTVRADCNDGANSCSTDVNSSDPNNLFSTDVNDQMENFMDYSACSVLFSEGQKTRMVDALENIRFSLIDPNGCSVFCSNPVTANFSASAMNILAGETVTFTDLSTGAATSTWTIDNVPFSGTQFTFNDIGSFTVKLQILGADSSCRDNFSLNIRVTCPVEADFTTSATQVSLNEIVNFSNSSAGATSYEWTLNNAVISSATNYNFSSTTPGIYTVCLTADNGICQSKKCQRVLVIRGSINEPCTGPDCEKCDNKIDDDGDGLIDSFDPDCSCLDEVNCGDPFFTDCLSKCTTDLPFTGNVTRTETDISVFWKSILIAVDIDGDCQPEICFHETGSKLTVLDGESLTREFEFSGDFGNFAAADVDLDNRSELFVLKEYTNPERIFLERYDFNPVTRDLVMTWRSDTEISEKPNEGFTEGFCPLIADFNQDDRPEIYVGTQIFDSRTGIQLAYGGIDLNRGEAVGFGNLSQVNIIKNGLVAADLLIDSACPDCSGLELAAGNQIMAVNIQSYTNPSMNSVTVARELPGFTDGLTAVADFDMDGDLDLIISDARGDFGTGRIYIWDGQTEVLIGNSIDLNAGWINWSGIPTVGDVDGDGFPEILINTGDIFVLEDFQTGGGNNWGNDPVKTIRASSVTGDDSMPVILFDFNLDGKAEIIYRNRLGLRILDADLNMLYEDPQMVGSYRETPIIADIDNDNEAELISFGCPVLTPNTSSRCGKLMVYESADTPWANTRKTWNQYSYFNVNINDDGSVPSFQQSHQLPSSTQMNSFNQQFAIPNFKDCGVENCLNGIDDDADGLVDFFDDDCPCITDTICGAPFYSPCQEICSDAEQIDSILFDVDYTGHLVHGDGIMNAADYDGDCEPEVCVIQDYQTLAILGRSGFEHTFMNTNAGFGFSTMASADVDNDGAAEIFILASDGSFGSLFIYRIDYNPTLNQLEKTWETSQPYDREGYREGYKKYALGIADFNQDGRPEVYMGNHIFDSETGRFLASAGQGFNTGAVVFQGDPKGNLTTSVAMDLLPDSACPDCTGLELAAGNQVFSVAINSTTNPSLNSVKVVSELPGFGDGTTAIVDFDLDGDLDIVVANLTGINLPGKLYIWDAQTPTQIGQSIEYDFSDFSGIAVPAIGDLDGDGRPEIAINSDGITAFEDYQTGGGTAWGSNLVQTIIGNFDSFDHQVGILLFDFNLDGKQEIVLQDQFGLFVLDGAMNLIGKDKKVGSLTQLVEMPVIIDWDDDQEAEILTIGCLGPLGIPLVCDAELLVINSASFPWANTRKIQNQFAYFNTNINDDGTVPLQQQSPHFLNYPTLNSFNQQYAMPAPLSAEATANIEDVRCSENGIEIDFEICNTGEENLPPNTPVAIYDGNPTRINAPLLLTFELADGLFPGECISLADTVFVTQDSVFVVVNDDGSLLRPFNLMDQFPPTNISECDYLNNISGIEVPIGNPPTLDLGPDILICDNGIFELDAGAGFETYRWSDESFERTYTAYEPGKYWVETTGICGTSQTDTIVIEIDPISEVKLGSDLTVCIGDTIQFDAGVFDNYKWLPKSVVDCDTCQIFNLEISQDTQVIVQVRSDLGCFSIDTIDIFVAAIPIVFDSISICRGDTILVNGTAVFSDTLLSQNINSLNGCDSILNTKITINDSIFIKEKIEICAGDTAFVFGNPITQNDTLLQIFNRANGCDSTHLIEVEIKPTLFESDELQLCEGDTVMVFGSVVTENDTISQIFTSAIGCDSTSEIRVVFTNSINTDEAIDLCAGDTVIVFGNEIISDSILFETYNSSTGCDSTHEVRVKFRPIISGGEMIEYCEGDTVMIFGNQITKNDTISEILIAENGCDSIATVEIIFNKKTSSNEILEFCEGDTALVFGVEIFKDSIVSQTFSNFNNCDSTHSIEVIFNKKIETNDSLEICAGDTVFVFGNPIMNDSIVSEIYTSSNRCDSTSRIKITVRPTIQTTDEIQLCEGDTAMIFGNLVTENDTLSEIFTSAVGCDSTSEIRVVFTNLIQTDESLDLCVGDTVMVFGNQITSDSILSKSFISFNGCDSIHEVRVVFKQGELTENLFEYCEGDTVIIFGKTITENDLLQETFTAENGCDSISKIEIIFNEKSTSNETLEFCEGDTALVFGVEFFKDSIVSKTAPNFNNCDSTHTVEIIFNQKVETFEQLEFCVGDTVFLFGNEVTENDEITQILSSINGCDSTHNINVFFLEEAEKMIFDSLCTGEILLFFNDTISETGTYFQTVPAIADGCDTNYILTAEFFEDPTFELVADTLIPIGDDFEIPLNISDSTLQVIWSPNENLSCENCSNPIVSITEETTFEATIINEQGCSVIARINIRVIGKTGVYIPTGFSPNNDGYNDGFTLFFNSPKQIDQLQIFDRWGGLVFELNDFVSNDPAIGWDGTARGLPVNSGVFVYKILFQNDKGDQEILAGDVTVAR